MGKIRDAWAKSTLGSEIVTVNLPGVGPVDHELRGKTVDEQSDLLEKTRRKDGSIDQRLLMVETVIATTYEPGTDEKAFDPADRDMLLSKDAGPFNELLAAANRAAGLDSEEEVTADLDGTPAAETSTG